MKQTLSLFLFSILVAVSSCREDKRLIESDLSEATVASETGVAAPLPPDVIGVTKSLVSGDLYQAPNFEAAKLTSFDTAQIIHVLDTTDALFIKARMQKDSTEVTGFVSKTILPE